MTANDVPLPPEPTDGPTLKRVALGLFGALIALFGAGVLTGLAVALMEKGVDHPWRAALFILIGVALVAGGLLILRRVVPHLVGGVASPRVKRARRMLYISMALGAVMGAVLQAGVRGSDPAMLVNGPLPPAIAALAIATWLLAVPLLSWIWWRNIDEVEADAYKTGALVAIYTYSFIAPTWWVGWRGGFFPEPQEMITFFVVITVWGLSWMRNRFR